MREEFIRNKIGFIHPKDWTLTKIGEISDINASSLGSKTDPEKVLSYIDLGSVNEGVIDKPVEKVEFKNAPSRARRIVSTNDVLMSTVRPNLRGFARADSEINGYICSTGFAVLTPKNETDSKYIFHSLFTETFQRQFYQLLVGSSYPAINNSDVEKLFLAIPNDIEERKSIVEVLSTWDEAISKKENLIQAKKRYKKGLMQRLLSGKARFPEFEGEDWVEVKLGGVFSERKDKGHGDLKLVAITTSEGVIDRDELDRRDTSSDDKSNYKRILPGDIGYNTMRMWQGVSGYSEIEGIVSPAYTIVTPIKDKVDALFMSYLFKHPPVVDLFRRYSQGLVSDTLNLKFKNFGQIKISIPPSIEEQQKIASVFTEIDKEIALLKEEVTMYRKQKKGLMQKLLTGKIRVN